jgi:cell division protein FtsB
MRTLAIILATALLLLQYELWLSEDGLRGVWRLAAEVSRTTNENDEKAARNAALEAEVVDLKQGLAAVEERARTELGMIGKDETYYLITKLPAPSSTTPK